ncbi:hypothetical protein NAEGRDRAFT_79736 [Naegleria gruberi]|uniref:Uncharacterized protein n=1 Tax=Naegleria gruberi TaxID=5762 RepID=D2VFB5_NAEGR|nr:uncharacterized protein NAEGRDRAFT_79736 [Naegleria gruberi]EFC44430.1 hypothetical protein NAEGRDRAFT_79736 [Naegleria gruberi]|eukprot:XP_002677174.1 hypothetical protein NAEGRDRAFT_79736 [Naegleria gruberi strain NEG-M]
MTLTMNQTFYAPRTDIAIGFQHPFMNQQATTTNFIYFKMMQAPSSSSVVHQHSTITTTVVNQQVSGELANSHKLVPSKIKGKEHSTTESNQQDSMEDDNDDDWIDVDEDDNVVPSKPKSKHFYFRHSEESDDESDEEDEEEDNEEMDEDDEFVDIEIPFWYGNEDPKHIEFVMKEYSSFLQLNKDRQPNSRIPIRFIGKIVREALEDTVISVRDEDDEDSDEDDSLHMQRVLLTSETIYIYQKSVQSPELCCKFDTSITVQTFYDYEEGVPISILIQPETEWDISSLDNVTLLECFPSFGLDPYAFEYGSHRVVDTRQILPHTLETSLGNAGLFNQCLQNSAGCLAKLKPKQQNESPKAE